jgi:hypothetical protein
MEKLILKRASRMGITCEPYRFFGSLFPFSLGGLDNCGVGDRTKKGRRTLWDLRPFAHELQ